MINFSAELEAQITSTMQVEVGVGGSDPTNAVVTFTDRLQDFDLTQFPALVIFVRQGERVGEDINAPQGMRDYTVHMYYLDLVKDWALGKAKRSNIMSRIEKTVNKDTRFNAFQSVDPDGTREYVWNSEITSFNFDSSGQEEYYSFVGEMYLTVHTAT